MHEPLESEKANPPCGSLYIREGREKLATLEGLIDVRGEVDGDDVGILVVLCAHQQGGEELLGRVV